MLLDISILSKLRFSARRENKSKNSLSNFWFCLSNWQLQLNQFLLIKYLLWIVNKIQFKQISVLTVQFVNWLSDLCKERVVSHRKSSIGYRHHPSIVASSTCHCKGSQVTAFFSDSVVVVVQSSTYSLSTLSKLVEEQFRGYPVQKLYTTPPVINSPGLSHSYRATRGQTRPYNPGQEVGELTLVSRAGSISSRRKF